MRSIVKCIYEHSVKTPNKTAIIATDCTVSYSKLWRLITGVCHYLKEYGIVKNDRVMLEADHTVEFLVCCYGIHLCGAVHVPIEKHAPSTRINEVADEINPSLIMSGDHPLSVIGISLNELD